MEQEQKIAAQMDQRGEGPEEPEQQMKQGQKEPQKKMEQEQEMVAPVDQTGERPNEPEQQMEQEQ